jgi:hypothetical protein
MIEPARGAWVKCPPGELQRLGTRLRWRRRRDFLFRAFVILLATAGIGCGVWVTTEVVSRAAAAAKSKPCGECPQQVPAEDCPQGAPK